MRFENSLKINRLVFCWEKVKLTTRKNKEYNRWNMNVFIFASSQIYFSVFVYQLIIPALGFEKFKSHSQVRDRIIKLS